MMSNAAAREVIDDISQCKYGAVYGSYTGSIQGSVPNINPDIGKVFFPDDSCRGHGYHLLAFKLSKAIKAAVPEGMGPILQLQRRSCGHVVNLAHELLCCDAYVLGEVDPGHPLLKIATLSSMAEFRAAVEALE